MCPMSELQTTLSLNRSIFFNRECKRHVIMQATPSSSHQQHPPQQYSSGFPRVAHTAVHLPSQQQQSAFVASHEGQQQQQAAATTQNFIVLRMHELEHRMMLLEQVVIGQRQTIDLLMNLQKLHIDSSVASSAGPSPFVPTSHPPSDKYNTTTVDNTAENGGGRGDDRVTPRLEGGKSLADDHHHDDTETSSSAALFMNRSRWAV